MRGRRRTLDPEAPLVPMMVKLPETTRDDLDAKARSFGVSRSKLSAMVIMLAVTENRWPAEMRVRDSLEIPKR